MESNIPKPEELTDAQAEAFTRLVEEFLETKIGKGWLRSMKEWILRQKAGAKK